MAKVPVIGLLPWRRGPLLLLKRSGVAAAVIVSGLVAVLPAAALPMFLDAAGTATFQTRASTACQSTVGSQASAAFSNTTGDPSTKDVTATLTNRVRQEADTVGRVPGLGPAVTTVSVASVPMDAPSGQQSKAALGARDGAANHVQVVAGALGPGLWIPDRLAERDSLRIGDTLTFSGPETQAADASGNLGAPFVPTVSLPVVAIYRDLRSTADTPFWCSLSTVYRGATDRAGNGTVPDLILTDRMTMLNLVVNADLMASTSVERPFADADADVAQAQHTVATLASAQAALHAAWTTTGTQPSDIHTATLLPGFVGRAALVQQNLRGTVLPITVAGSLVGLAVVAAAGIFWVRRRRQELIVLHTLGATPASLGLKGLFETGPAIIAGAAAGWWLAHVVVASVGPTGSAIAASLWSTVAAIGAAFVVVWATAMLECRHLDSRTAPASRVRRLARVPWEIVPLAGAAAEWVVGGDDRIVRFPDALGAVAQLPSRVLVTPMLVTVGAAAVAVRMYAWSLRQRERHHQSPPSRSVTRHLTRARLRSSVAGGAILLLVTTVPITLAIFGATAVASVKATLANQARFGIGADVVITLTRPAAIPASLVGRATIVSRVDGVRFGAIDADLLAVDPSTFADAASWGGGIDGHTLAGILETIRPPATGGVFPVVGASPIVAGIQPATSSAIPLGNVEVHPISALPAEQGGYPVALADRSIIAALDTGRTSLATTALQQMWVAGDPATIRRDALAAGLPMSSFTSSGTQLSGTYFQPFTYTFGYLSALAIVTGLVAAVGFVLYLESRLPTYRQGFIMLRAMSLSTRAHLVILLGELAAPIMLGLAVAMGTTAALLAAIRGEFVIDTSRPPGVALTVSTAAVGSATIAVVGLSLAAVLMTQRRVIRSEPSEVLRDTE